MELKMVKRLVFILISLLIFLIIVPTFNGIFSYILMILDANNNFSISFDDIKIILYIAFVTTAVPASISGCLYAILFRIHAKTVLLWLIPLWGCIIHLIYTCFFELITHLLSNGITIMALIISLISIGSTFIATLISNIILRNSRL